MRNLKASCFTLVFHWGFIIFIFNFLGFVDHAFYTNLLFLCQFQLISLLHKIFFNLDLLKIFFAFLKFSCRFNPQFSGFRSSSPFLFHFRFLLHMISWFLHFLLFLSNHYIFFHLHHASSTNANYSYKLSSTFIWLKGQVLSLFLWRLMVQITLHWVNLRIALWELRTN